jgi:glycosyltransferase involved in cell wall biosynthesis
MHIGIAGPISFDQLGTLLPESHLPFPKGLGGTPVNNLILELWKRGHKLSIYSLDPSINTPITFVGERIKIFLGPYRKQRRGRDFFKAERDFLYHAISSDDAPLVNAHWTYEFALPTIKSGKPYLITCHDSPLRILYYQKDFYRFIRFLMAFMVFKKGTNFSAVSPYIAKDLQFFISRSIKIIPNFAPESIFNKHKNKKQSSNTKIVTINNGWGKLKNPKIILLSFALVKKTIPDAELTMYGYDFGPGEIAYQWAKKNNLIDGVTFRGFKSYDIIQDEIAKHDLLLHTSLEESFGMTIVEAMAIGIPVIGGSKSGAVPWLLDDGKAGLLVDITSPIAIADAVITIIKDQKLTNDIIRKAKKRAIHKFHPNVVVSQYEKIYEKILASQK